ncbi:MAG: NADH-quinone oxidoreductase subunit M [Thermoplasmata archaeon]|nr:NADH-quinone oxidoreductase subunit M [Thermoplasmata archaeon]MCI4359006.1 NADH-quinone oxidoreductase subunit M [Thermoplasmata archaeon]
MLPVLSILLATLLASTLLTFLSGRWARYVALAGSVVFLVEVLLLLASFTQWAGFGAGGVPQYNDPETYPWISISWLTVNYAVGIDGISLVLVLLTAFLLVATVVYSWREEKEPALWFGLVLLTCLGCYGVFVALDILLFFLFWEAVLIPMFFLIGYWGGPRRRYAALKFFVYTHVASIVMLVSLLAVAFYSGAASFDFTSLYGPARALGATTQVFLFLGLFFGFGVKFPIVPFHTWLPDAHVEAPTGGSVLLAGLLLKLGAYGLIRWAVELLPTGLGHLAPLLYAVAIASIVWGSVVALAQRDLKRLVAYSSINHMGIVLLAIAVGSSLGVTAAVLLMFAHGIVSALLFMVSGSVHHTFGTRDINAIGGITPRTPALSTLVMVGSLASLGLPALISFPAEFGALLAAWDRISYWVLLPLLILVVTAAFYMWLMQRMLFGPPKGIPANVHEPPSFELAAMSILAALIVLYGVVPSLLVQVIVNSPIQGWP